MWTEGAIKNMLPLLKFTLQMDRALCKLSRHTDESLMFALLPINL
jgi:hypothetical protein